MMRLISSPLIVLTSMVTIALPANAETAPSIAAERLSQSFALCRAPSDAAQKLSCYERTVNDLEKQLNTGSIKIVDNQDISEARRSLFGFTLPKIDFLNRGSESGKGEGFNEINSTVAGAKPTDSNCALITLADKANALWRTTDQMDWLPRIGDKVRIERGTLGGYFLTTGGKSYRATRVH